MTDEEIVLDCQNGDYTRFDTLYDAYLRKIYDFVFFKTLHRETAEDITSQVFHKLVENIGSFDGNKGAFSAWLFRIARNAVIDHFRSFKRTEDIEDVWMALDNTDIARETDATMRLEQVENALRKLTPEQREIVMMRIWQDLPFAEIARILGKNEAAVKMAYKRAITAVRKEEIFALLFFFLAA